MKNTLRVDLSPRRRDRSQAENLNRSNNLNESIINKRQDEVINIFLDIFDKVKVGGYIIIPEGTYQSLRSKRMGMEALLKASNLRIEFPQQYIKNVILASKS